MRVVIGTSGWLYHHWQGRFYPRGLATSDWLGYYAARFATVEINATFYRLPRPGQFEAWARATPDDFVFAVKASRYLTHVQRLREPDEAVAHLLDAARRLGAKLGPILLQLPPTLRADVDRLEATLDAVPAGVRVAVEFRHGSWFVEPVQDVLVGHGAALCLADGGPVATPAWRTADWTYLRLHRGRATPEPCYGQRALRSWVDRLGELAVQTAFVYFNNDPHGCAVRDATAFASAAERAGHEPTRVASARDVWVD